MKHLLKGCHVLIVDDEPLIAIDLAEQIEEAGAFVVGPASTLDNAMALSKCALIQAAVLDIRLGDSWVYPLAEVLRAKGVPFVFATGHEPEEIPVEFADVPCCAKPFKLNEVVDALAGLTGGYIHPDSRARASKSASASRRRPSVYSEGPRVRCSPGDDIGA
jgi:DNA-binding response OmpR family regulator